MLKKEKIVKWQERSWQRLWSGQDTVEGRCPLRSRRLQQRKTAGAHKHREGKSRAIEQRTSQTMHNSKIAAAKITAGKRQHSSDNKAGKRQHHEAKTPGNRQHKMSRRASKRSESESTEQASAKQCKEKNR